MRDGERRASRSVGLIVALRGRENRPGAGSPVLEGTFMAGAGSSKVWVSLAREGGGPILPYCMPLPGLWASPDRSSSAGARLLVLTFVDVDPDRKRGGSSTRLPARALLVLRGGVKLWLMPKKVAGVPVGGPSGFLVNVGVAFAR
jgi:hypothetical protein